MEKYFGYLDSIGKVLMHSNQFGNHPFTVTGIFKDLPPQTDYPFDIDIDNYIIIVSVQTLSSF